jgi:hypothetical protein
MIALGTMIGVFSQQTNVSIGASLYENGLIMKAPKEDDTCSVQTTDDGLELESMGTSRQTSEWSSISEDDSSHQGVFESEYSSERESLSDVGSEISEEVSTHGMKIGDEIREVPELSLQKTKMCKFFLKGTCTKGLGCNFAHDSKSLKNRPSLFRTSLCMAFERSGSCKLGENCKYAQGR